MRHLIRRSWADRVWRGDSGGRLPAFLRGLALGALIGAALAGSSVWRRRRR